jgi:hypothetical protein
MSIFSRYGIAAACAAVVLVASDVLLVSRLSAESRSLYGFVVRLVLYALAATAASIAAAQFGWWGERFGRAWTLFALEFAFLLLNYVLRRAAPGAQVALEVTLVVANVAQIAAYWIMARMLAAAGIVYLTSTGQRVITTVAALAFAVLLCHTSLLAQWEAIRSGVVHPGSLVSVLADVITFTLIAPLAASTLALRGGRIAWIFAFLGISVLGWMINTGAPSIADTFGGGADALRSIRLAGVAIATLFNAAAAAAQSLVTARSRTAAAT